MIGLPKPVILIPDSGFLINLKKTKLHLYLSKIFEEVVTTRQIEKEVVTQGIRFHKPDAFLTKKEIDEGSIRIETIEESKMEIIEKVAHKGEASILSLFQKISKPDTFLGLDDKVFSRYVKYVYPAITGARIPYFSSLDYLILLFRRDYITKDESYDILTNLERIGAHDLETIMTAHQDIERFEKEN